MALSFRSNPQIWDKSFSGSGVLADGSHVKASYTTTTSRLKAHLILVLDVSYSMEGAPLAAVVREVGRILRCLDGDDFLTMHTFASTTEFLFHGRVRNAKIDVLAHKLKQRNSGMTALYDAVTTGVASVTTNAHGSGTARFLTVLSDGLDNISGTSAGAAKLALEQCSVSNFYPILVSAGAAGAYDSMRAQNATYIQVGSTSDDDLRQAFKEVTEFVLCKLQVSMRSRTGAETTTTLTARGTRSEAHRNMTQNTAALLQQMGALRLEGGGMFGQRGKKPCTFYAEGRCKKGASCNYAH